MFLSKNSKRQLALSLVIAVLLGAITWFGLNFNTAKYDKPIAAQNETSGKIDIIALLQRFSGTDKELNTLINNLKKDSLNPANIKALQNFGTKIPVDVYSAYALYLQGINENIIAFLQQSASLFFESGTHDPDSLADKTTYSVYSIRACDRILKTDPKNLAALTSKGIAIVYFGGAIMEGVGILKQVESIDSNYVDAQQHLMILDLQSGQFKKAEKRVKKLLHLQPENQQYAEILLKLETQQIK